MRILTQKEEVISFSNATEDSVYEIMEILEAKGELKKVVNVLALVKEGIAVKEGRRVDAYSVADALITVIRIARTLVLDVSPHTLAFIEDNGDVGQIHILYRKELPLVVVFSSTFYLPLGEMEVYSLTGRKTETIGL